MKLLLLGANGQVGWELQRALAPLGQLIACDRQQADLSNLQALSERLDIERPDIIINAAAYTAVDQAEQDERAAFLINADAVGLMADKARQLGSWLVHYSTDYVFDGRQQTAYVETDATNPQSVYGRSKLAGEQRISASGCQHLIFRTSWVYARRGHNFARTMLKLAADPDALQVVADQQGAPTSASLIADITALCLYRLLQLPKAGNPSQVLSEYAGIYHLVASGCVSWHGYACYLIAAARAKGFPIKTELANIAAISSEQFSRPAKRPANSQLATGKLSRTFDIHLPHWQQGVDRLLDELRPELANPSE